MDKILQKYPVLGSSVNPQKLGLTVKGVLAAIITVLVTASGVLPNVTLDIAELQTVADQIQNAVVAIAIAYSAIATVLGGGRKIYIKYFDKKEGE